MMADMGLLFTVAFCWLAGEAHGQCSEKSLASVLPDFMKLEDSTITTFPVQVGTILSACCKDPGAVIEPANARAVHLNCTEQNDFQVLANVTSCRVRCAVPTPGLESGLVLVVVMEKVWPEPGNATYSLDPGEAVQYVCRDQGAEILKFNRSGQFANITGATCLQNGTMAPGDVALYECLDPRHVIVMDGPNGTRLSSAFRLECQIGGEFAGKVDWPACTESPALPVQNGTSAEPDLSEENPRKPCQCLGDLTVNQSMVLLDLFCRNTSIPGNERWISNGYSQPTKKRCGSRNPDNPTLQDLCHCDRIEHQANLSFWMVLSLGMEPWEWSADDSSVNPLARPGSDAFDAMRTRLEKAIDSWAFGSFLTEAGFVQSFVVRFFQGPFVLPGTFPDVKPTPTTTKAETTATTTTTTIASLITSGSAIETLSSPDTGQQEQTNCFLSDLRVPSYLNTSSVVLDDILWPGQSVKYGCVDAREILVSGGAPVGANEITISCSVGGDLIGVPNPWHECLTASNSSTNATMTRVKRWSHVDFFTPPRDYHYINAEMVLLFKSEAAVSFKEFEKFYQGLGGPMGPLLGQGLSLNKECNETVCRVLKDTPRCSNEFLDNVTKTGEYVVWTKFGLFEVTNITTSIPTSTTSASKAPTTTSTSTSASTTINYTAIAIGTNSSAEFTTDANRATPLPGVANSSLGSTVKSTSKVATAITSKLSLVNNNVTLLSNLLEAGDLIEVSCVNGANFSKRPVAGLQQTDSNSQEGIVMGVCTVAENLTLLGSFSIQNLPKCVAICLDPVPVPTPESGLVFKDVIPAQNFSSGTSALDSMKKRGYLFEGDRLVYQCSDPDYGVHGGPDELFDLYACAGSGSYDLPPDHEKRPADSWPSCQDQRAIALTGAKAMLDRLEQRISDRVKLIAFKEEDNRKQIVQLPDLFLHVSIPVMCALLCFVFVCCCCSIKDSLICKFCGSRV